MLSCDEAVVGETYEVVIRCELLGIDDVRQLTVISVLDGDIDVENEFHETLQFDLDDWRSLQPQRVGD
jgi:hypothetical protein